MIQIWGVSNSHALGVQQQKMTPLPGEGLTGQISFNFNYKVNFKVFIPNFGVCSYKRRIQNISDRFSFCHLNHALGV